MDIEVVEHSGGTYSSADLLKSDRLLVLPPVFQGQYGSINVGKGQWSQIIEFRNKYPDQEIWVITGYAMEQKNVLHISEAADIFIDELHDVTITGGNWQTEYAELDTNDAAISLYNYGIRPKVQATGVSYKVPSIIMRDLMDETKPMNACVNLKKRKKQ